MATEIQNDKCIICDAAPLVLDIIDQAQLYGTCKTCAAFYSRAYNGVPTLQWNSPYRPGAILLLREYWEERHTKLPPMDPNQPHAPGIGTHERDSYNEWSAKHTEEIIRLGNEAINEHRETLRRLA